MAKEKIVVPSVGESVTEVTVARFIAPAGSFVKDGDPVVELESDKASMEVPAPISGVVSYLVKEGDVLEIGKELGEINSEGKGEVKKAEEPKKEEPKAEPVKTVSSGPGVRKSPDDYLQSLENRKAEEKVIVKEALSEVSEQVRKPMSKMRKVIAKRLVQVKNETAMLTTFNEVDMKAIMDLRNREKDDFLKKHGAKLTFLPFFIKAAVSALQAFPDVNAYIEGDEIVYNIKPHVGIAVSTDTGLVVPVMRNTSDLSFIEITKKISELAAKAKDRKLTVSDMSGGTFTITNGGVFGSMLSTPILNPPQSAILGMHNIVDRPVAIDGKVEIRPIMYLALSYDHRIVDGKESVSFLVHMKKLLEDPVRFVLEG